MFKVRCFIPHALERLLAFTFQFLFFFWGRGSHNSILIGFQIVAQKGEKAHAT